jgi:hypothetical protein
VAKVFAAARPWVVTSGGGADSRGLLVAGAAGRDARERRGDRGAL